MNLDSLSKSPLFGAQINIGLEKEVVMSILEGNRRFVNVSRSGEPFLATGQRK